MADSLDISSSALFFRKRVLKVKEFKEFSKARPNYELREMSFKAYSFADPPINTDGLPETRASVLNDLETPAVHS